MGCWNSFESPGVEPTFANPNSKQKAIDYACGRFGGFPQGEVHIYADDGKTVERIIPIEGGSGYASVSPSVRVTPDEALAVAETSILFALPR